MDFTPNRPTRYGVRKSFCSQVQQVQNAETLSVLPTDLRTSVLKAKFDSQPSILVSPVNTSYNYGAGTSRTNTNFNGVNGTQTLNGTPNGYTQGAPTQTRPSFLRTTVGEKIHFFTGTAERVQAWNRLFKERCYFEVIASVVSVQNTQDNRRIILLKDKKGPILQVVHYCHHEIQETEFHEGQVLRCVGYMTGINTFFAVNIRTATSDEVATLKRFCYIGDFTISGLINSGENH